MFRMEQRSFVMNNQENDSAVKIWLTGEQICQLMALLQGNVSDDLFNREDTDEALRSLHLMESILAQVGSDCYPYSLRGQASAAKATLALAMQAPASDVLDWLGGQMERIVNEIFHSAAAKRATAQEHICDGCPGDPAESEFKVMDREIRAAGRKGKAGQERIGS
jgi:hypothetical protein